MILVTGGTGLVGSHLLYDLAKTGKKVKALKRAGSDTKVVLKTFSYYSDQAKELFAHIEWVEGDIMDYFSLLEALKDVTEIYHCAAKVSFSPKDQETMLKTNVEGTANMVNAALEKGIRKFCHISSIATLGKSEKEEITEESYWKSTGENSVYSLSKYAAEREVWRAAEEGLPVIIVNPAIILGPGNWNQTSSNLFKRAHQGILFYTNGGSGFVDVRDVSKAMLQLMNSELINERFILSSENYPFKQFFDLLHEQLGKEKSSIHASSFLSAVAWRAEKIRTTFTGKPSLITKETARAANRKSFYSNGKIKALGYSFIPIEQSIKDTCKLFLTDLPDSPSNLN